MSKTFPQGVKDLKISAPTTIGQVASKLRCKVVLVAKYDFASESPDELSVKRGDVLKLLDRLSNGWVLVEFIDKILSPGLVPCLYVDIAANDPLNPITLLWLHEMSSQKPFNTFYDVQVQMLLANNSPLTINNKLYPLTVSVTNYLMFENRFWYRVDVTYSNGEQGYLCRYYLDFYDLHLLLLDYVNDPDHSDQSEKIKLPKLPEPIPSNKRDSAEQTDLFSKRCRDLSAYMNELIANKRFQVCSAIVDWIAVGYKELPGFTVEETLNDSSEVINQRILPGSIILGLRSKVFHFNDLPTDDKSCDSIKYFAPSKEGPKTAKSKNIYNHYQQAANFSSSVGRSHSTTEGPSHIRRSNSTVDRRGSELERSRTVSNPSNISKTFKGGFAPPTPQMQPCKQVPDSPYAVTATPTQSFGRTSQQSPGAMSSTPPKALGQMLKHASRDSPSNSFQAGAKMRSNSVPSDNTGLQTPSLNNVTPQMKAAAQMSPNISMGTPLSQKSQKAAGKLLKCEIKMQNNDSLIVRVQSGNVLNVREFKAFIYKKLAFNNLFIKLPDSDSYEEIDPIEDEFMTLLRTGDKLSLLVT